MGHMARMARGEDGDRIHPAMDVGAADHSDRRLFHVASDVHGALRDILIPRVFHFDRIRHFGVRSDLARGLAIVAVVTLSLGHIYTYSRKTHDADWRESGRIASSSVGPGEQFAVVPAYAVEVVRYYMPAATRQNAIPYDATANHARVVILAEHGVRETNTTGVRRDFPRVIARTRGIVVLSR